MPMGLADALTRQEFLDLGSIPVGPGQARARTAPAQTTVVRRWRGARAGMARSVAENPDVLTSPVGREPAVEQRVQPGVGRTARRKLWPAAQNKCCLRAL